MATNILEASVKLFAEDSALRASFQGLAPHAQLAGTTVGDRFAAGIRKATAKAHENFRKEFIGPLSLEDTAMLGQRPGRRPADQYRASDLAAHKGIVTSVRDENKALGENARTRGAAGQAAAQARRGIEDYNLSVRDAAGTVKLLGVSVLSQLNPVLGESGSVALRAARNLKGLGVGMAAGGAAAAGLALAVGLYIAKVRESITAQVALAQAMRRGDFAAVDQQARQASDAVGRFEKQAALAVQPIKDLGSASEVIVAYWENKFGPAVDTLRERLKVAVTEAGKAFAEFQVPKLSLQAAIEQEQLATRGIEIDRQQVGSTDALRMAVDKLVQSREQQAEAQAALIEQEARAITRREQLGELDPAVADAQRADVARRALNARKQGELDIRQIRRDGRRDEIAFEERQRAHAIDMGRISMADQLAAERAATTDLGRTLQEREDAERKVFNTRRQMAESFFTFQSQITGKSLFREQIEIGRQFMSELVTGSAAWFAQVSKVSDLFTRMREQAKGIFSQQVSLAESEASRQGMTTISVDDIGDLLRRARERDERALRGDRVRIGDIGAAVGRVDLFRTMDREGLSPREAFSRMMEDPSKNLARALEGLTTPVLTGLADAATLATRALLDLAGTSPRDGGSQPGPGPVRRLPGGPPLSEENRQAIMDAISTRLTEEHLAVYGRR